MKPEEFISVVAPIAVKLRLEGSPIFPSLRIAQAAHETGWTIHPWNNLVGFKAGSGKPTPYWDGSTVRTGTWESVDGKRVSVYADWRAYTSIEDGFRDQGLLFRNARYARVRDSQTPIEQAQMLQACGYATDPQYAKQITALIGRYRLYSYDEEVIRVLEQLKQEIEQLRQGLAEQDKRIKKLESRATMKVPDWARDAVDAAVKAGIVVEPEGGSWDFYRLITVLHRKGLI